ncbi:hypothetical protein SPRG_07272 [Saprolegnia parasitica CBS 223.65]|uniref:Sister chromatid cohesion protein DCC1 n=2 Tax=Saprolegnia parasitica (strain CBS 223.65) TaxID=695850 RepID=A0A067CB36_SAPPC|nr:hypothetical protein SPRG_07272 [Saprolegnia parasitica CBS 223.65]KDO27994.1 hypothetical protein SPRG_07272 [Saprolegnia parasitica CBS 223.65]|eukprot:XP_012201443.1 hypothetical protein SPRG_07272 [Saprolegnia parasitica CBS 223.65]
MAGEIAFAADFTDDGYKLLELPADVCDALVAGDEVYVVGDPSQRAVLCTATKSYHLVREDQSNVRLLADSVDWEADKLDASGVVSVRGQSMTHYELVEKPLDLNQLKLLLIENPICAPSAEVKRMKRSLYTLHDLADRLQHSPHEVELMLAQLRAVEIDGYWRLLEASYSRHVVGLVLEIFLERDWDFNSEHALSHIEVHLTETVHSSVLAHCLRMYSVDGSAFRLDSAKIAIFQAIAIFEEARSKEWTLAAFMEQWGFRVPMGVAIDAALLVGLAIRRGEKLAYFPADQLSVEPKQRFQEMFAFQPKWLLSQMEPYLAPLVTKNMTQASLLLKYTRASRVPNSTERLYSKR